MKKARLILSIAFIVLCAVFMTACSGASSTEKPTTSDEGGTDIISPPSEVYYDISVYDGEALTNFKALAGESVTVVAAEPDGKLFLYWEYQGELAVNNAEYTFTASEDAALNAKFCDAFTVTLEAGEGTVPSDTVVVGAGTNYTLPVPEYEYHVFLGWYDGTHAYTDEEGSSLDVFLNGRDVTLTAMYEEIPTYTVTLYYVSGTYYEEALTDVVSVVYHEGDVAEFTLKLFTDRVFKQWQDIDRNVLSDEYVYSFTVRSDIQIFAVYDVAYRIAVIGGTGSGTYGTDEEVVISPLRDNFLYWSFSDGMTVAEATYAFTPKKSLTVTAVYSSSESSG